MTRRSVWGWGAATIALGVGVSMMTSGPSTVQPQSFGGAPALTPTANTTPRDSLVATITFIFDDNYAEDFDSANVFKPASGNWNFKAGLTLEPESARAGADSSLHPFNLSRAKILALYRRGWSMGTVGWDEKGSLYAASGVGLVSSGNGTSENPFNQNLLAGLVWARDTLQVGAPKWISWSTSSATSYQQRYARSIGIKYGYVGATTASADGQQGTRPNVPWLYRAYTTAGNTTASVDSLRGNGTYPNSRGIGVTMLPGSMADPLQMYGVIGENTDSTTFKRVIWKAIATKSAVIWCGHKMSTWDLNLDGQLHASNTVGRLSSPSECMSWINKYVKAGKLRVVPMDEFVANLYERPISPEANWLNTEFEDWDGPYMVPNLSVRVPDNWQATNAIYPVTPIKPLISRPKTGGYLGHKYVTLNWGTSSKTFWGYGSTRPWFWQNMCGWMFPPKGSGWTAHLEFFAICDSTVASGVTSGGSGADKDSVGVMWWGAQAGSVNDYSSGNFFLYPASGKKGNEILNAGSPYFGPSSVPFTVPGGVTPFFPGNAFAFETKNNIYAPAVTGKKWLHVVTSWDYPPDADILYFNIWKDRRMPSGEVRISYPYLTFTKSEPVVSR